MTFYPARGGYHYHYAGRGGGRGGRVHYRAAAAAVAAYQKSRSQWTNPANSWKRTADTSAAPPPQSSTSATSWTRKPQQQQQKGEIKQNAAPTTFGTHKLVLRQQPPRRTVSAGSSSFTGSPSSNSNNNRVNSSCNTMKKRGSHKLVLSNKGSDKPNNETTTSSAEDAARAKQPETGNQIVRSDEPEMMPLPEDMSAAATSTDSVVSSLTDSSETLQPEEQIMMSQAKGGLSQPREIAVPARAELSDKSDEDTRHNKNSAPLASHEGGAMRKIGGNKLIAIPQSPSKTKVLQKRGHNRLVLKSVETAPPPVSRKRSRHWGGEPPRCSKKKRPVVKRVAVPSKEDSQETGDDKPAKKLTEFAYRETSRSGKSGRVAKSATARNMGLVRVRPDQSKTPICATFLRGVACTNPRCMKRHDVPKEAAMPICSFFQWRGQCLKGDSCRFRHIKVNPRAMICPSFELLGFCEDSDCQMKHIRPSKAMKMNRDRSG